MASSVNDDTTNAAPPPHLPPHPRNSKIVRRHSFQVLPSQQRRPSFPANDAKPFLRSSSASSAWDAALERTAADYRALPVIMGQRSKPKNKRKLSFQGLKQFSMNLLDPARKGKKGGWKSPATSSPTSPLGPKHGGIKRHLSMDNIMPVNHAGKHPGFNKRNSLVIHNVSTLSQLDLSTMNEQEEYDDSPRQDSSDVTPVGDVSGDVLFSTRELSENDMFRSHRLKSYTHRADRTNSISSSCSEQITGNFFIGEDKEDSEIDLSDETATSLPCRTKIPMGTNALDNFTWRDMLQLDRSSESSSSGIVGKNTAATPSPFQDSDTEQFLYPDSCGRLLSIDSGIALQPYVADGITYGAISNVTDSSRVVQHVDQVRRFSDVSFRLY